MALTGRECESMMVCVGIHLRLRRIYAIFTAVSNLAHAWKDGDLVSVPSPVDQAKRINVYLAYGDDSEKGRADGLGDGMVMFLNPSTGDPIQIPKDLVSVPELVKVA